jgi:aminotransferase
VVPGSAFCADGDDYIRCAYATRIEVIEEAMDRMARFIGRL